MAAVIFVLAMLMPAALGSSGCLTATLPGILDLGTCLGTSVDLCDATTDDIVSALVNLVQCLLTALTSIDAEGAVSALLDIITPVITALGLDASTLTNLIKPLCAAVNVDGCAKLLSGSQTCSEPITINLPGDLNLGQCIDDTLLLCGSGEVVTDELLANLVDAVVCLLNTLLGSNPGSLINGLACVVADLLQTAASSNVLLQATLSGLSTAISTIIQCS